LHLPQYCCRLVNHRRHRCPKCRRYQKNFPTSLSLLMQQCRGPLGPPQHYYYSSRQEDDLFTRGSRQRIERSKMAVNKS
jgi:hypothetical protein